MPRDGDEEQEEGPCLLVIQGTWVHGAVALQPGLGHHLLSLPLKVRGGEKERHKLEIICDNDSSYSGGPWGRCLLEMESKATKGLLHLPVTTQGSRGQAPLPPSLPPHFPS